VVEPEAGREPCDLLIIPRWVIPVEPHGAVLEDHAVAVAQGRILAVRKAEEARRRYAPAEIVERPDHVLLPGLINAHTHNPMSLMRGLADDLPLMRWLSGHIWPAEQRVMGPEFVAHGAELAVVEMVRGGTTCCNENYFFPDVLAATYRRLGFRAVVGLPLIEFPSAWAREAGEYIDKAIAVHDQWRDDPLIAMAFAPHAPYTVGDESFRRIGLIADQLGLKIHLHLLETADEVAESRRRYGMPPLARIAELGLLDERLIAVHMTQVTAEEIPLLARSGASVVHCPESNLKLASGFCPVARLRAAGVTVALGTDGCASNNDLDLFGEMRTAALLAKGIAGDAAALPAIEVLRMATIDGARALGLADRIGSIEPGKEADLITVDLGLIECQPVYQPLSHLIYATQRSQVCDVWIGGERKLQDGRLVGMELEAIRERARFWRRRLAEHAA
jgi:5-methylthioadenosine/S-adenosylhomocysteine deaminase